VDENYELYHHVGLDTLGHTFVVTLVREARRRGLALGPAWAGPLARARAFAERTGARWWLEVLAEAGV
jgi:hypothetical protein